MNDRIRVSDPIKKSSETIIKGAHNFDNLKLSQRNQQPNFPVNYQYVCYPNSISSWSLQYILQ